MSISRKFARAAVALTLLAAGVVHAQSGQFGTAGDAEAMLDRVMTALVADKEGSIKRMNDGDADFRYRDLYPVCANLSDGIYTVAPATRGKQMRDVKDAMGKPFGAAYLDRSKDNEVVKVTYMWPRPGSQEPALKVAYVGRAAGQVCAVGYYR